MQTRRTLVALIAMSLAASSTIAFADPDDHRRGHEPRGHAYGHDRDRHDDRRDVRRDMRRDDRHDDRAQYRQDRPRFYRGGRLPPEYRSRQYVVDDWRGHRLSAPPRGYHWVQAGGDYVLAAIATGVILSVLLNH